MDRMPDLKSVISGSIPSQGVKLLECNFQDTKPRVFSDGPVLGKRKKAPLMVFIFSLLVGRFKYFDT